MKTANAYQLTGFVMPVGNGAVGKTSLARILDLVNRHGIVDKGLLENIRKTNNMEFEYIKTALTHGNVEFSVTLQILVPSGQKQLESDPNGRTFGKIIEIYKSVIQRLDVVLFTYDMTNRESFYDLGYWADSVGELLNDATHFILLGTHLDRVDDYAISKVEIEKGLIYLRDEILAMRPTWVGNYTRLEVSNLTGDNLQKLLHYLASSVISSRRMMP